VYSECVHVADGSAVCRDGGHMPTKRTPPGRAGFPGRVIPRGPEHAERTEQSMIIGAGGSSGGRAKGSRDVPSTVNVVVADCEAG
jgi:hypothetical protein